MLLPYVKLFLKIKRGLKLVSLPYFLHEFWRKIFLTRYFDNWLNFIAWLSFLLEILGNMCIVIICCPVCEVINVEVNHSFLIKPFSYITKKSEKIVNISRTKTAFNMKQKEFFIILRVFIEVNETNFLEDESPTLKRLKVSLEFSILSVLVSVVPI